MKSIKLGAILAGCLASQVFALTTVTYTLELDGGSATYVANWKNPPGCQPELFAAGSTASPQTKTSNTFTWGVRVAVSGTQTTPAGVVPSGVANVVFDLQLKDNSGTLVGPSFGKGSAGAAGFYSAVNNNTNRTGCFSSLDPDEAAAFTVAYSSVNPPNNGRLVDDYTGGGPGMTYYQFPSTFGFPGGSTALSGTLNGAGAGYPLFKGSGCPGGCGFGPGVQTAGVGWSALGEANCSTALGTQAVVEGQLNMTGLADGTYTLTVVPGAGTNVLNGNFACQLGDPGAFALKADATTGGTITIVKATSTCGARSVVGRWVFFNNSFYDTPSTGAQGCNTLFGGGAPCNDNSARSPNITALLPGQTVTVPVTAPHGVVTNHSNYTKGINGIMIDLTYTGGAGCALPAGTLTAPQVASTLEFIESSARGVTSAYTGANRTATATVSIAAHPTLASTDRITIIFPDNTSTNARWLRTRLLTTGVVPNLAGEDKFYFGLQKADGYSPASGFAVVDINDQGHPKAPNAHNTFARAPINESYDYDHNSLCDINDQGFPKAPNAATTFTALQLTGVAP